jgi:hypothetical protein
MGEWQRDANAPCLHVEGERGQLTALLTITRCWVMTLSTILRTGDWGKLREREGQLEDSLKQEIVSF